MAAAHHGQMHFIGHGEADLVADFKHDGPEHAFGIEQRAIHVKDHGLKRGQAQQFGLQCHHGPI